jgi:hypothetical protein
MFESITKRSDGLCEILRPEWSEDEAVNARIALAGPCVGMYEQLLDVDDEFPETRIVQGLLVTRADGFNNPNHGYSSDLAFTGGRVSSEAESAYAWVATNIEVIESIGDEVYKSGGDLPYARVARIARGKTSSPTEDSLARAAGQFMGHSRGLRKVDESILSHL